MSPQHSANQATVTETGSSQRHTIGESNTTPSAHVTSLPRFDEASARASPSGSIVDQADVPSESDSEEPDPDAVPVTAEAHLANPLAPGNFPEGSYTADSHGKHFYLGTSSNWSFGRRVLNMAHQRVSDLPLPASSLLFEGSTYDLGWDGQKTSNDIEPPVLPTLDFALYLINSVKFHCGQLYHMFDEETFMNHFHRFHSAAGQQWSPPTLWYIHYLIILAFGKAFIGRNKAGSRPSGADLFVQAMKMLPHTMFLCVQPLDAIEVLCSAALYLQCLDYRTAAYNLV